MFSAHSPITIVILVLIVVVVLGYKRLPEIGRSLGQGMREFKDSITGKDSADDHAVASAPEPEAITKAQASSSPAEPDAVPAASDKAGAAPRG
ncbi:MAG TPA: twin-arginine translocase TatA/TatE family subunit [Solirubrobacteraceae bacterium]|nr:twin-arginine translocase TatA/TatE family subunit [Solirubrobacteraceae bacterium]